MLGTGRNLGGCTIVNFGLDGWSRGRKALTQYEEAQLLRILHNRWLQWRFVNARAEAVISAQKTSAEVCTILEQGSCFSIGTTLHPQFAAPVFSPYLSFTYLRLSHKFIGG
jgi:hypothetical protein